MCVHAVHGCAHTHTQPWNKVLIASTEATSLEVQRGSQALPQCRRVMLWPRHQPSGPCAQWCYSSETQPSGQPGTGKAHSTSLLLSPHEAQPQWSTTETLSQHSREHPQYTELTQIIKILFKWSHPSFCILIVLSINVHISWRNCREQVILQSSRRKQASFQPGWWDQGDRTCGHLQKMILVDVIIQMKATCGYSRLDRDSKLHNSKG